jgi:hypothetical protein
MGPGLPLPMGRLSHLTTGQTSAPVPVKKLRLRFVGADNPHPNHEQRQRGQAVKH